MYKIITGNFSDFYSLIISHIIGKTKIEATVVETPTTISTISQNEFYSALTSSKEEKELTQPVGQKRKI